MDNPNIVKGSLGEQSLITWFHANSIPFLSINQSPDTFAHFFARNGKRPDFLVLFHSLGLLAVDAKNCRLSHGYFTISEKEIIDALTFQMIYRIAFWFVFLHEHSDMVTWYWISSIKALSFGLRRQNNTTGETFRAISLGEFIAINNRQDLGKLWIDQMKFQPRISNIEVE